MRRSLLVPLKTLHTTVLINYIYELKIIVKLTRGIVCQPYSYTNNNNNNNNNNERLSCPKCQAAHVANKVVYIKVPHIRHFTISAKRAREDKCFKMSFANVNCRRRSDVRLRTVSETKTSGRTRTITMLIV